MKIIVHSDRIGEKLMDKKEFALKQHEDWHGKIEVVSRAKVTNREELSVAYTPGVAEPCLEISKDVDLSYKYTRRSNLVAGRYSCTRTWRYRSGGRYACNGG